MTWTIYRGGIALPEVHATMDDAMRAADLSRPAGIPLSEWLKEVANSEWKKAGNTAAKQMGGDLWEVKPTPAQRRPNPVIGGL